VIVAVLQLAPGSSTAEDLAGVGTAVAQAVAAGATLVICPCLPSLLRDATAAADVRKRVREVAGAATVVLPCAGTACGGLGGIEHGTGATAADVGSLAVLCGDEAIGPEILAGLAADGPDVLVWQVEGESPLQAEAIREYAIAASESVSGLVLVASLCGTEIAAGGSAIVFAGDIVASAGDAPELLTSDIPVPVLPPETPGALGPQPPLLAQRLAAHRGERAPVDYPADLRG
jgi:hypothetical protein